MAVLKGEIDEIASRMWGAAKHISVGQSLQIEVTMKNI